MNRLNGSMLAILAALVFPVATLAAPADNADILPEGSLVRYFDDQGRVVITSTLPPEAIKKGYELIDGRGRVLRTVAPALPEEERLKAREALRASEQNQQLTRLYPTPQDAQRARDRQITALRLQIDYARSAIVQLDNKLAVEVEAAAAAEQAGREVPAAVAGNIETYTKQIREQEEKIAIAEQGIVDTEQEFAPIIDRLQAIHGGGDKNKQSDATDVRMNSTAE